MSFYMINPKNLKLGPPNLAHVNTYGTLVMTNKKMSPIFPPDLIIHSFQVVSSAHAWYKELLLLFVTG